MATTKSLGQKDKLDKFYTKKEVASLCISQLNLDNYDVVIEPSAGSGNFSSQIEGCIAYDIAPEHQDIIQQDFLALEIDDNLKNKKVLVIGNPPFGVQNNLAIAFFNHSAKFADTIAFILPKSFRKQSVQNRLSLDFSLVMDMDIEDNSFQLNNKDYNVPAIFQIWKRISREREDLLYEIDGIKFVNPSEADFRIQRVGGNAGKAFMNPGSKSSNYFIQNRSHLNNTDLIRLINLVEYESRDNTVGPRSISKPELLLKLKEILENN